MTVGKASALAAGFVGAVALGVAIGPTVHDRWSTSPAPAPTPSAVVTESAPAPPAPPARRGDLHPRRRSYALEKRVRKPVRHCRILPDL